MTPAQRERLNRFLAEKVTQIYMPVGSDPRLLDEAWKDGENIEWEPPNYVESWADCGQLLNKIERDGWVWCWDSYDNRYTFEIMRDCESGPNENSLVFHASGETRTEALCLAIAKAYGWKEER